MRYTPEKITSIQPNEIFVFGSNLKGQHGGGAANVARGWGAGRTYAIPTKYDFKKSMPVDEIRPFIDQFILFARDNPQLTFIVTKIGCGLAGHSVESIAPLFNMAIGFKNVVLPKEFIS